MKANELMIGDLVMRKQCFGENANLITDVYMVDAITKEDLYLIEENKRYISKYCNPEIVPIPLTAEILEKNGFVHRQSVTWGDVFTYTYAIVQKDKVLQYEQHFNLSPDPYDGSGFYWIPEMSAVSALLVVYVHELQHLLRLCGIEKEIEL